MRQVRDFFGKADKWLKQQGCERVLKVEELSDGKFLVKTVGQDNQPKKRCFDRNEDVYVLRRNGDTKAGQIDFVLGFNLKAGDILDPYVCAVTHHKLKGWDTVELVKCLSKDKTHSVWAVKKDALPFRLRFEENMVVYILDKEESDEGRVFLTNQKVLKPGQQVKFNPHLYWLYAESAV